MVVLLPLRAPFPTLGNMYDPDKYKSKAMRSQPSQSRGKERVRVILASALKLFQQRGFVAITTNEIAEHAQIPIGSLYRYYPNKNALLVALTDLYINDVSALFEATSKQPLFDEMDWHGVMLLVIDPWLNYVMLNGPFDFLYAAKANPSLGDLTRDSWARFFAAFANTLHARCPELTIIEITVAFHFSVAAVSLGSDIGFGKNKEARPEVYYAAVEALAGYMRSACARHDAARAAEMPVKA
jgi:AcrR family transcriptional regulator